MFRNILILAAVSALVSAEVVFEEGLFETPVDPLVPANTDTFNIRYWKYDGFWD